MSRCPCCSSQLLRYVRGKHIYWFCRNCWQEMPELLTTASSKVMLAMQQSRFSDYSSKEQWNNERYPTSESDR